jgi:hypothetical protein
VFHIHLPADIEPAAAGDEDGRGTDA